VQREGPKTAALGMAGWGGYGAHPGCRRKREKTYLAAEIAANCRPLSTKGKIPNLPNMHTRVLSRPNLEKTLLIRARGIRVGVHKQCWFFKTAAGVCTKILLPKGDRQKKGSGGTKKSRNSGKGSANQCDTGGDISGTKKEKRGEEIYNVHTYIRKCHQHSQTHTTT